MPSLPHSAASSARRPEAPLPAPPLAEAPPEALDGPRWHLASLRCRSLAPTIVVRGRQLVRGYEFQMREGTFFVEAFDPVAQLTGPAGQRVVLSAEAFWHVQETHTGARATSRFADSVKIGWLVRETVARLPLEIEYPAREARLEFQHTAPVGTDVIASRQELVADGRIAAKEAASIDRFRREIVELNLFGSIDEQHAFIRRANEELAGTAMSFIFRRDTIVPHFEAPPAQTDWWTIVVIRTGRYEPAEIRTIYPGRVREPFCGGRWFFALYGADRASRGLAILELLSAERPLVKAYQQAAVEAQARAQRFWLEHGLVAGGAR